MPPVPSTPADEDRLTRMLRRQLELQRALNNDPTIVPENERANYVAGMLFAAMVELGEASSEVGWKSWASSRFVHGESCFGELRDAFQFLVNAMYALYGDDPAALADRFEAALNAKIEINLARTQNGYSGTNRCHRCRRALDDVQLNAIWSASGVLELVFCVCGATLDPHVAAPYAPR